MVNVKLKKEREKEYWTNKQRKFSQVGRKDMLRYQNIFETEKKCERLSKEILARKVKK
jgi:hypothetical protein